MILETAMHEVIHSLVRHGYAILIFWIFSEKIGVPIPALPPLLAAGALAEGLNGWRKRGFPVEPLDNEHLFEP